MNAASWLTVAISVLSAAISSYIITRLVLRKTTQEVEKAVDEVAPDGH